MADIGDAVFVVGQKIISFVGWALSQDGTVLLQRFQSPTHTHHHHHHRHRLFAFIRLFPSVNFERFVVQRCASLYISLVRRVHVFIQPCLADIPVFNPFTADPAKALHFAIPV